MGARSSRSRGPGLHKTDGHLVEYCRDSFGAGGGAALAPTQLIASGGTTLTDGGYKYHVFTTSGAFSVTSGESSDFEVLVVGGGGSGGSQHGGGGGAGGVVYNTQQSVSTVNPGPYSVAIGAGGPAPAGPYTSENGVNGSDSQFGSPGDPIYIISKGGSAGGGYQLGGGSTGASGGGAGGNGGPRTGGSINAPSTSPSTANTTDSGGKSYQNSGGDCPGSAGSGGGGAGGLGGNAPSGSGGNGGNGQAFPGFPGPGIYNAAPPSLQTTLGTTWRDALGPTGLFGGGGGGGGHLTPSAGGPGGPGGGGAGGRHVPGGTSDAGENGVDYTGGAGGGSGANNKVMGTGGTGIVIVRYLI